MYLHDEPGGFRTQSSDAQGFGTLGSALVLVDDERAALATVLVLQEMGQAVDVASDRDAALTWVRLAHYGVIVCGTPADTAAETALRLRFAAPGARVLMLSEPTSHAAELDLMGIEVLQTPISVNTLVDRLRPAA